ncbi:MAG: PPOX class F420-dependent oxidoreductase [Chloroflexi bacterium]|uniref:PPOX class F420-dependent oxidoreductase n=1 Tax=Candidatus Flexifilum breve TaxID=3140694 RepID=UPI0031355083|nr:PPOX class F420-dependent oxidoreductase [Chloroflexota bacterium]
MAVAIPNSHHDLIDKPVAIALVTMMPDGQPQATPVWFDYDGEYIRVNTARGRQKDKNMAIGSPVTLLAIAPDNMYHWMEIRGRVAVETEEGALEHINALSAKYRGVTDYYSRNEAMRGKETRVTYKIEVLKVNTSYA